MPNPAIKKMSPAQSRIIATCRSWGFFFLLFLSSSAQAQLIDITWEVDTAFYEATEPHPTNPGLLYEGLFGYVTYDVYANFTNSTDQLISMYASDVEINETPPMYISAPCGCYNSEASDALVGGGINPILFPVFPEIQYDTFWTLDLTSGESFTPLPPAYNSTTMCSEVISDGAIFLTPDAAPSAGPDLRIQIAQVTTCGDFAISACFQTFVEGDNSNMEFFCIDDDVDGESPLEIENPCANYLTSDAQIEVMQDIDCFGELAVVDVVVNGVSPITYELYNAIDESLVASQVDNVTFSEIPEGEYYVAILDGNTCRDTSDTFGFTEPDELIATWELLEDNVCADSLTAAVQLDFDGGTGLLDIFAFSDENVGNGLSPNSDDQWLQLDCINGNGEWQFQVEDENGCQVDTSITISCVEPLELVVESFDITCYDYNDGAIVGSMSGGTGELTLAGSPALNENISGVGFVPIDLNNVQPADYLLVVTDENDCSISTNVSLIEPDSVTIVVTVTDLICADECEGIADIAAFGGTGEFDYSVTDEDAMEWALDALCAGIYFANATDINGCVVQDTFVVDSPQLITFDVNITDVTCFGEANGSICLENTFGGTGGLMFQVDPPAGGFVEDSCFAVGAGTFVLSAMDEAGCIVNSDPQLLIEPDPIQLILEPLDVSCTSFDDGMLTVSGIGGTGVLSLIIPESELLPYTIENLAPGPIEVTVEDENGCSFTNASEVIEPDSLVVEWLVLEEVVCGGDCNGSAVVDFAGGTGAVTLTLNGSDDFDFNALCAGLYTANVVDGNLCADSTQFEILQPDPIEVLIDVTNVTCTGMSDGAVNIFPIGGTGDITWEIAQEGIDLLNLFEGVYNVLAIDSTGCAEDTAFVVGAEEVTDMILNMLSSPVTCWNEQDGTTTASLVGGYQPVEFLWSDELAQTTATATGLYEDTYSVVVIDSLGCTLTDVVSVDPTIGCFFIAEAITPNGDGYNDEWIVGGLEYFPTASVKVYNRWGQELFSSIGYKERWDGRYNNAPLPVADYYYVIEFAESQDPITGTVTLKY
jgi:gliding motility-associated-like protein